ncbi:hypothetical protein FOXB_16763 [Fusarium oxysporum f. sp. conglutinans Fo5176]|uniref:2EXR domain-containing protein n=1 Tax=Fusarium oxysporum (strain Fo5176) TaxID=660025 RepID=F9GDM9_FUSOF|nr:hypothetical protein FOXB_16763 [Fusarium oxysporum f. sp. conglutinans Fo5176]
MPVATRSQLKVLPLEHFPLEKLPVELQQMIWSLILPSQMHYTSPGDPSLLIRSPPLPAALLVNTLSRETAQRHLSRFLRDGQAGDKEDNPYGYFNPKLDLLHIDSKSTLQSNPKLAHLTFPLISVGVDLLFATSSVPHRSMAKALKSNGSQVFFCSTDNVIQLSGHEKCRAIRPVAEPQPRAGRGTEDADSSDYYFRNDYITTTSADFPAVLPGDNPSVHWVFNMPLCCGCRSAYRRARKRVEDKRETAQRRARREAKRLKKMTGST